MEKYFVLEQWPSSGLYHKKTCSGNSVVIQNESVNYKINYI
jgi:hypothetical protein